MKRRAWLSLLLVAPAWAVDVAGVKMPDRWPVDGRTLVLNGAGVREHGWLRVHVYAAALYLPARSADAAAIIASVEPRVLHMQFLRNASREDTLGAWDHYFAANCTAPCTLPVKAITQFKAFLVATVTGETQTYVFRGGGVTVLRGHEVLGTVGDAAFSRLLLSTWIGAVPTTPELKMDLLGAGKP